MAEAHPIELRQRVVDAYEAGEGGYTSLSRRFAVGEATVKRWMWQFRREGGLTPQKKGGGNRSRILLTELEAIVGRLKDATAGELTAAYNLGRRGCDRRHVSSIKRALYRAGYVVKKNASGRWNSSGPTSSPSAKHSSGSSAASQ